MKELRLRQIATPLKDARKKDARVERAAVFVEKLFGRPMKSNPDVLIINGQNKAKILEIIREDYPNAFIFTPYPFLITAEQKKQIFEDLLGRYPDKNFVHMDLLNVFSPLQAYRQVKEIAYNAGLRATLEEIAGIDDPGFIQKVARTFIMGVQIEDMGMVVTNEVQMPPSLVHELIHAEDQEIFGKIKNRFRLMVAEGRATFGDALFSAIDEEEYGPLRNMHNDSLLWHVKMLAANWRETLEDLKGRGLAGSIKSLRGLYVYTAKRSGMRYQLIYLPFAIKLHELAKEVGNAFTAFQMITEKPPESLIHVVRASEYYRDEISKIAMARCHEVSDQQH